MIILWPIAGKGSRFDSIYSEPKPFIPINNKPMIEHAISSLSIKGDHYVIANSLEKKYSSQLTQIKDKYDLNLELIQLKRETRGQAETSYLGLEKISPNTNEELIITNSDQYTPWNSKPFIDLIKNKDLSAVVTTYKHRKFKINETTPYSHVKLNNKNLAIEFAEKVAISQNSLNGIYYWKKASYFLESANKLLYTKTYGEKWLSLSFNYMISDGHKISIYEMKKNEFFSLGTPEDLNKNIANIS